MGGHPRAWIFTSATLAVQGRFQHYCGELGLGGAGIGVLGQPLRLRAAGAALRAAGHARAECFGYTEAVVDAAFPALQASGRPRLLPVHQPARHAPHPRAAQGTAGATRASTCRCCCRARAARTSCCERFRHLGNAILVGSQSFWEGVDVRGEALSLVVIDKLPFAPPDDPVLAARIEQMRQQGRNAFMEYQLPRAVINVKQGAGRLIRDETDRGVLMICDPRLISQALRQAASGAVCRR